MSCPLSECSCYAPGTVAGLNMCHASSGQCTCKLDVVGRRCDTCASGFYGLSEANPFGCTGMYFIKQLVVIASRL